MDKNQPDRFTSLNLGAVLVCFAPVQSQSTRSRCHGSSNHEANSYRSTLEPKTTQWVGIPLSYHQGSRKKPALDAGKQQFSLFFLLFLFFFFPPKRHNGRGQVRFCSPSYPTSPRGLPLPLLALQILPQVPALGLSCRLAACSRAAFRGSWHTPTIPKQLCTNRGQRMELAHACNTPS